MQTMKQCTDAAADKLMTYNFGGSAEQELPEAGHQTMAASRSSSTRSAPSAAPPPPRTRWSHGDFNSAYTVEVTSHARWRAADPGVAPGGETHMKIAAQWIGACAAGQRPGDVVMSNGMTMNVLDLQKRMAPQANLETALTPRVD